MNKKILLTICLLASLFIVGCSEDKDSELPNGNVVAIRIPIIGISEGTEESAGTRNTGEDKDTITVTQELGEGFILESVLTTATAPSVETRASNVDVNSDVRILMIAYRSNGSLYKYEYFTAGNPIIHLPIGEIFRLVFYSYNNTEDPNINITGGTPISADGNGFIIPAGASLGSNQEIYSKNVMWTKIETPTITPSMTLPEITFKHMFAQVEWTVTSTAGAISESQVTLTPTFEWANVHMGNLINIAVDNRTTPWETVSSSNFETPIEMATNATEDGYNIIVPSKLTTFCPNESENGMSIKIVKMKINNIEFSNQKIEFKKSLQRGIRYKISSTLKRRCEIMFTQNDWSGGKIANSGIVFVTSWGETLYSEAGVSYGYIFDGWYWGKDGFTTKLTTDTNNFTFGNNGQRITVIMNGNTENQTFMAKFKLASVSSR